MTPEHSTGCPDIDHLLGRFPDSLVSVPKYLQRIGYKCWKVPGRRENWLQWNDGGTRLPIQFENSEGEKRTWKVFARFGADPGGPWEKPATYAHDYKFMPGGDDVWGCSCEGLRKYLGEPSALEERLRVDAERSYAYAVEHYR